MRLNKLIKIQIYYIQFYYFLFNMYIYIYICKYLKNQTVYFLYSMEDVKPYENNRGGFFMRLYQNCIRMILTSI